MRINLSAFQGQLPRLGTELLPDNAAQSAKNCKLYSGELRPLSNPKFNSTPTKVGTKQSLYLYQDAFFFHWLTDVDAVPSAIANNADDRIYYTGDGVPKYTYSPIATSGGTDYPTNDFSLGVPAPTTAPTITPDALPSGAITGASNEYPVKITAVAHGRATGQRVYIDGVVGMTSINKIESLITVLDANTYELIGVDGTAYGVYTSGGTWTRHYLTEEKQSRYWVYTFVSELGEEGPPSPASAEAEIGYDQGVTLSNCDTAPAGTYNCATGKKRAYRSLSVYDLAEFQLAHRVGAQGFFTGTTYADDLENEELQEVLPSVDWDIPPTDLQGLVALPNGVLAGFRENEVCFCEPWQFHAWPAKYRLSITQKIVGLASIDESLVVMTDGHPELIIGTVPGSMSQRPVALSQACTNKRGIADLGYAAIYPSPDGLALAGPGVSKLVTEQVFTREEWQKLKPSSMHGYYFDDRYICFYDTGTEQGCLLFDPKNPTTVVTFAGIYATAGHTHEKNDTLYLQVGNDVVEWDADATFLTYEWKSKAFRFSAPDALKVIKVIADAYPVTVNVWADDVLKATKTITSKNVHRLPGGFEAEKWEFEISGTAVVKRITLATTPSEIANG